MYPNSYDRPPVRITDTLRSAAHDISINVRSPSPADQGFRPPLTFQHYLIFSSMPCLRKFKANCCCGMHCLRFMTTFMHLIQFSS